MPITALLFAKYRTVAGQKEFQIEYSDGATVRQVASCLEEKIQDLELTGALCALNESYTSPDTVVADGDTIAFLPPVSGG
ncbi:MAG: MoaD/ThiS family protein [Trueperaceae bacterium]|nr:MAG: MoaD/ThiS family protein [Trueperaceae bacterium]